MMKKLLSVLLLTAICFCFATMSFAAEQEPQAAFIENPTSNSSSVTEQLNDGAIPFVIIGEHYDTLTTSVRGISHVNAGTATIKTRYTVDSNLRAYWVPEGCSGALSPVNGVVFDKIEFGSQENLSILVAKIYFWDNGTYVCSTARWQCSNGDAPVQI